MVEARGSSPLTHSNFLVIAGPDGSVWCGAVGSSEWPQRAPRTGHAVAIEKRRLVRIWQREKFISEPTKMILDRLGIGEPSWL